MFLSRLIFLDRPARPGDLVWLVRHTQPRDSSEVPSFAKIWFPRLAARGTARMLEDGSLLFWSRRVRIVGKPLPLTALGRLLAWDRPGQALFAREVAKAEAVGAPIPPRPADRHAKARGGLPLIRALGGKRRGYLNFWLYRAFQQGLRRLAGWPDPGVLDDSGVLVDRCSATLCFLYSGTRRRMALEQIRRHPNGNFHFVGRLLPTGEARTFSYAGIAGLEIEGHPALNPQEIWVELNSLTTSAFMHHQIWTKWCEAHGLPLPPPPDALGRIEEALRRIGLWGMRKFAQTHPLASLLSWLSWAWAETRPLPKLPAELTAMDAPWRDRLHRAAWRLERGLAVDLQDLEKMRPLAADRLFARALLRGMLTYELRHSAPDDWSTLTLNKALSLLPPGRKVFTWAESTVAWHFYGDLEDELLSLMCWPPDPWSPCERLDLLAALAIGAAYGGPAGPRHPTDPEPFPPQATEATDFVQALLAFAAVPDNGWIAHRAQAPRWRWLAGFMPGD
jgi:hypothetical protein